MDIETAITKSAEEGGMAKADFVEQPRLTIVLPGKRGAQRNEMDISGQNLIFRDS